MQGLKAEGIKVGQKLLIFIFIITRAFYGSCLAYADPGPEFELTLDEATRIGLKNSFEIQMVKYDAYIKRNDLLEEESIFDAVLTGKAAYRDDRLKTASSLSGTSTKETEYGLSLEKKLPSGTTIETEVSNERTETNSPFVSLNSSHEAQAKLKVTQELGKNFFGLIDRGNIEITRLDIENSEYTSLSKVEGSLAETQKAYWGLALADEILRIEYSMLEEAVKLNSINKDRHTRGLIEDPDVFASEANVKYNEKEVVLAKNRYQLALSGLLYRLNLKEDSAVRAKSGLEPFGDGTSGYPELVGEAMQHRRDYKEAKNTLEAKNIKLSMKKNSLWPEINLELSLVKNGIDKKFSKALSDIFDRDNPEYYAGINFSLPLDNRKARGQFNKATLEKAKAILELKRLERKILVDVKDRLGTLLALNDKLGFGREIVKLQEGKLRAEERRYLSGRSDSDTLIRYQQDLLKARLEYFQSMYDVRVAHIELMLSANILLDKYWQGKL